MIVESKDYAQVIFDDVENCYAENQAIECSFTINELLKPDSSDAIGIFKASEHLVAIHAFHQSWSVFQGFFGYLDWIPILQGERLHQIRGRRGRQRRKRKADL